MAISAISAVSGGAFPSMRLSRAEGPLSRVQAIPALAADLARSDDAKAEGGLASGAGGAGAKVGAEPRLAALDPRGPESIVSRREAGARLGELLGEKAAIQAKQAVDKGERTAEVVSQLSQLKARDAEVRAHEAAHVAAGGRYVTGGASYSYQKGPDGGQYAVGGEVGIDSSPVPGKPEETVQKMRTVRAAALAPSQPSGADLAVAAAAAQAEAQAMAEIAQAQAEELAKRYGAGKDSPQKTLDMVA
jgi:hypothetical protein